MSIFDETATTDQAVEQNTQPSYRDWETPKVS